MPEITVDVGVRLQVIQSSIAELEKTINKSLNPDSSGFRAMQKILTSMRTEAERLQIQMNKGFGSQQQFNQAGKTIEKLETSLARVKITAENIKFSDIKLNSNQQKMFDDIEQQIAKADAEFTEFQNRVRDGIIQKDSNQSALKLIGFKPGDYAKSFDEISSIIDKGIIKIEQQYAEANKRLEAAQLKAGADFQSQKQANSLLAGGISKESFGAYDDWFRSSGQLKVGRKREDMLKALFGEFNIADEIKQQMIDQLKGSKISEINDVFKGLFSLKGTDLSNSPFKILTEQAQQYAKEINPHITNIQELESQLQIVHQLQAEMRAATAEGGAMTPGVEKYNQQIDSYADALQRLREQITGATKAQLGLDGSLSPMKKELEGFTQQLNAANAQFLRLQQQKQTFNSMKMAITNFMGFNQVLSLTKRAVKDAMNHIKQLDSTMNGISIVTDMTTADLWKQVDAYSALAQKFGTTIQGAYDISKIYYQQGLETKDVMVLTEETLKLSKVSGLDYAKSTDYMTTALRGFKMEMQEASTVVDVYSNLAANTAVSQEELAVAMSKTASSMESVGSTFQDTSAMIATMVAVTRESATNIGSAMKSIASRYGELTKDPQKLLDSEGEAMSFNKVDAALQSVGISMQTTDHQFRDFTDVIVELSEKWDTLDSTQQRYIATQFAGNRQQSRFLALVSNGDLLKENMEVAANSEDVGTIQALKAMDSIESKMNQVQVAAQQFYTTLGAEGVWKGALDGIRNYIDGLNNLPKLFGKVPVGAIVMISNLISVIKGVLYKGIAEVAKIWKNLVSPEGAVTNQSNETTIQQTATSQGQAYLDALGAFVAPAAALWKKIKHPEESQEKINNTQPTGGSQLSETTSGTSVNTNVSSSVEEAAQQRVAADQAANDQMVSNAATTREKITEQYTQLQTELKQILEQAAQEKLTQENAQREALNHQAQEQIEELQAVTAENQNNPAIVDEAKQRIADLRAEIESRPILASIELSPQESVEVALNYLQEKFDQVKADIAVNADTTEATSKLMAMDVLLQDLDNMVVSPEAELDDKILDFADRLSDILRKIREINENPVKIEGESLSQPGEPKPQESSSNTSTPSELTNNVGPDPQTIDNLTDTLDNLKREEEEAAEETEHAADSAQNADNASKGERVTREEVAAAAHEEANAKRDVTESTKEANAAAQQARQNASKLGNISMALNMIAGLIDKSAAGGRVFAGVLMTVAGAMKAVQAYQLAIAGSNPWMAIATALTMVISGISTINESDAEELERLSKASEEANNRSKEANANYKLLDRSITKLNELKEARYDSAEAAEEYQTAVDELAEKYPQLITNLDAEGNAVIEAASLEAELEAARRKSAIATMEAAEAEKANIKKEIEVAKGELADTKTDINEYNSDRAKEMRINSGDTEVKTAKELGLSQDALNKILGNQIGDNLETVTSKSLLSHSSLMEIDGIGQNEEDLTYFIENEEKLDQALQNKYGTEAEMIKSVIKQLVAVDSETDKSIQELYGQLTSGELTEEEYSQGVQELITLISSDAAASYTYGPLLELLENYQTGTSTIQEFNDKLEAANKKSVSGKLLSNAEDYKFYQGLGDVQGLLVDALSRTTSDASYRNILDAFKNEYDLLNTIDQQLFLEMWGNRDQYSVEDFKQVFSGNDTILQSIRDYYADVLPNYQSLLIDKLNTQFNKEIVVTDDIYGKSIEEEIFSTGSLGYLKLAINNFKHGISADLQNWISNILDLIHSYEGQGMTNAADDVARETADVLNELDKIDDINIRTSITSALKNNDITNISGIDSALKELEGVSGSEEVRKQLEELKNALIYNLPLAIDAYTDKLISEIEDVEKNIKDISKGMSISEALAALDKINAARGENQPKVSLSDMKSKGGKIYFDDQKNNLRQEYVNAIIGDLYTERNAIQEQIDALDNDNDGKESKEALERLNKSFNNDPSQFFNIEEYQDIAKILMDLGYASGIKDEETGEITKFQLEAEKFKELMVDDPIGIIIAALTNRMANANSTIEFTEKELQASEAINAGEYVNALAFKGATGYYKNKNEVLNALAASKTGEELGINYDALKPVQEAINSAYDSFFSDLFTKGVENLHFEDYQLDMDQDTWNQMLSMSYNEIVATYGNRASMLIEEQNALLVQAIEKDAQKTKGASDALKNITLLSENKGFGDLGDIQSLADALGIGINTILGEYNEQLRQYSVDLSKVDLSQIDNGLQILADSIQNFLSSIADDIGKGLEGKLDYAGRDTLIANLQQYGMNLNTTDFTRTADGLKLSQQKAIELYNTLKQIDGVTAKLTFDSLVKSLEETNENYTNISTISKRIADLQQEISKLPVNNARRQEYEAELKVAQEIYRVRSSTDNKDFDFMSRSLPNGMANPISYWDATGEAYKSMNKAAKSGYMEIQDFYNIVNEMNNMAATSGQTLTFMGKTLSGSAEDAARLIEAGMSALKNIDGEGVKVSLKNLGAGFKVGAADMTGDFDDGVKAMAKSQIKMLDAAINMLEAIVAMDNIDINGDGTLGLTEVFTNDGNTIGFTDAADQWLTSIEKVTGNIMIGDQTLREALLDLAKIDASKAVDMLNQIRNIDWTLGDTNVMAQVQNIISTFFPGKIIAQERSIFDILNIPKDAEEDANAVKAWAKKMGISVDDAKTLIKDINKLDEQATKGSKLYSKIEEALGLTGKKNTQKKKAFEEFVGSSISTEELKMWDNINISTDAKGNITDATYTGSDGGSIQLPEDRNSWQALIKEYEANISLARTMGGSIVEYDSKTKSFTFKTSLGAQEVVVVTDKDGNTTYQFPDNINISANSWEEAVDQYLEKKTGKDIKDISKEEKEQVYLEAGIIAKRATKVTFTDDTNGGENPDGKTPEDQAKQLLDENKDDLKKSLEAAMSGNDKDNTVTFDEDSKKYKWHIKLPNNNEYDFETDGAELNVDQLTDDALAALGIDGTLMRSIAEGIKLAFQGEAGKQIGQAIKDGIKEAFNNTNTEEGTEGQEVPISNIILKPATINFDISTAEKDYSVFSTLQNIPPEAMPVLIAVARSLGINIPEGLPVSYTGVGYYRNIPQEYVPVLLAIANALGIDIPENLSNVSYTGVDKYSEIPKEKVPALTGLTNALNLDASNAQVFYNNLDSSYTVTGVINGEGKAGVITVKPTAGENGESGEYNIQWTAITQPVEYNGNPINGTATVSTMTWTYNPSTGVSSQTGIITAPIEGLPGLIKAAGVVPGEVSIGDITFKYTQKKNEDGTEILESITLNNGEPLPLNVEIAGLTKETLVKKLNEVGLSDTEASAVAGAYLNIAPSFMDNDIKTFIDNLEQTKNLNIGTDAAKTEAESLYTVITNLFTGNPIPITFAINPPTVGPDLTGYNFEDYAGILNQSGFGIDNSDSIDSYLNTLKQIVDNGGQLSQIDLSNLDKLASSDEIDSIKQKAEENKEGLTQIKALADAFADINGDNLATVVTALADMLTSAQGLQKIPWDTIAAGIRAVADADKGTPEGDNPEGNTDSTQTNSALQEKIAKMKFEVEKVEAQNSTVEAESASNVTIESTTPTINATSANITATTVTIGGAPSTDNGGDKDNKPSGEKQTPNNANTAPAEQKVNVSLDVSQFTTAVSQAQSALDGITATQITSTKDTIINALNTISTKFSSAASNINSITKNIKTIPDINKQVTLKYTTQQKSSAKGTFGGNAFATGTRTLMGELGPEMVVTNGHYYVVGENGAEFVNLAKDSIVFNHKQTKKLLNNGAIGSRGKPTTTVSNAISFAKGGKFGPARYGILPAPKAPSAPPIEKISEEIIASVTADPTSHKFKLSDSKAKGDATGPALASAAAALSQLKAIRAMWQRMLDASAKDLGSQAGRGKGGGGGGGGGGKDDKDQPKTTTADIQRWYNWLRQIEHIEMHITEQEKLQSKYESDRIVNGELIYKTQKDRLKLLDQEIVRNQKLAELQKSWYDNKRKELAESSYGKIFTYDEYGLQQYVGEDRPGSGVGLDILENLTRRNVNGQAVDNAATAKKQLKYLQSVGFDISDLLYNDDGTKVAKSINKSSLKLSKYNKKDKDNDLYVQMMENFWNNVDAWRDELDSLYDSYHEQLEKVIENQTKQNELIQAMVDNELSIEQDLVKAIEDREQAEIDRLQDERDALDDASSKFLDGLNDSLSKEREMYEKNQSDNELTKLQRQLAILQRSGGSASQIKSLQDQIASKQKDAYFDAQQSQIDAIQEASDKQIEKLDTQIDLMTQNLEYQKENGLLWKEVRDIMNDSKNSAADVAAMVMAWSKEYRENSALQNGEDFRDFTERYQEWEGFREDKKTLGTSWNALEEIINADDIIGHYTGYLGDTDTKAHQNAIAAAKEASIKAYDDEYQKAINEGATEDQAKERAQQAGLKAYQNSIKTAAENTNAYKSEDDFSNWIANEEMQKQLHGSSYYSSLKEEDKEKFKEEFLKFYSQGDDGDTALQKAQDSVRDSAEEKFNKLTSIVPTKDIRTYEYIPATKKKKAAMNKKEVIAKDMPRTVTDILYFNKKKYLQLSNGRYVLASDVPNGGAIYDSFNYLDNLKNNKYGSATEATISNEKLTAYNEALQDIPIEELTLDLPKNFALSDNISTRTVDESGNVTTAALTKKKKMSAAQSFKITKVNGLTMNKDKKVNFSSITVDELSNGTKLAKPISITKKQLEKGKLYSKLLEKIREYINKKLGGDIYEAKFKTGGIADFTGPAWLDGTPSAPEAVLNAAQTKFLREDMFGNSSTSLISIVTALQDAIENTSTGSSTFSEGINIENVSINFQPGVISNDYSAKRAGDMAMQEIIKIARKAGNNSVSRR